MIVFASNDPRLAGGGRVPAYASGEITLTDANARSLEQGEVYACTMELSEWHMWFKQRGGRQLRSLLMEHWDPIEVRDVPEAFDEYDGYIGRIAERLRDGAAAAEVAAMLSSIRIRDMGLAPEPKTDTAAATTIVAWYAQAMRDAVKPGDGAR